MPSHRPHLEPHLEPHLGPRPPSRTTPIQTHRPSLASGRARMRSAVPTRFPGAHECTQSGPPPGHPAKSPAPLPRCQLARTGDRGQGPRHLGAQARPPPHHTPRPGLGRPPPAKSSAPLQCCQLAKGRAHWNRPPWHLARTRGRRRPRHLLRLLPRSCPGPRLSRSTSPSAAKAHARFIQPTGEGSWTSRVGPRTPVMPVAAP